MENLSETQKLLKRGSKNKSSAVSAKQRSNNILKDLTISMNTLSCGLNLNNENICMLPLLMSLVRNIKN
jgi:hypothetical protein